MKRHKSSRHRKRSAMRITHPLSIQEKPEAVSRKSHNIKKQNRKRNNCRCGSCGQEGRKEKNQLPITIRLDERCKHKPISPALSSHHISKMPIIHFIQTSPRKNSLSRRKRTKKIRDTKDPDNFNHHAKMVGSWKETGKAVGGDTLLLYLTRNTHISSILTSRSPLLYTHHPGRSKENSSLTRVHCR